MSFDYSPSSGRLASRSHRRTCNVAGTGQAAVVRRESRGRLREGRAGWPLAEQAQERARQGQVDQAAVLQGLGQEDAQKVERGAHSARAGAALGQGRREQAVRRVDVVARWLGALAAQLSGGARVGGCRHGLRGESARPVLIPFNLLCKVRVNGNLMLGQRVRITRFMQILNGRKIKQRCERSRRLFESYVLLGTQTSI